MAKLKLSIELETDESTLRLVLSEIKQGAKRLTEATKPYALLAIGALPGVKRLYSKTQIAKELTESND